MQGGYTPVFGSIYTGTLYGRWPAAAVWASLLPLFDKNGVLDISVEMICGMTGWPRELLTQGIEQLMQPDPRSRTKGEDGKRMVLLAPDRDWGWRAVNFVQYREKARLMGKNEREVADGRNAARMQDRRRPPETAGDPLSDSDSDSDSNTGKSGDGKRAARAPTAQRLPQEFSLNESRRAIATKEGVDPEREHTKFCDHWRAASGANARKHDWDAAWRNWCRKAHDMRGNGRSQGPDPPQRTWRPDPADDLPETR